MGANHSRGVYFIVALLAAAVVGGVWWWYPKDHPQAAESPKEKEISQSSNSGSDKQPAKPDPNPLSKGLSHAELTNSLFTKDPSPSDKAPNLKVVPLPDFSGAFSIWGATGRERGGNIFFGISAHFVPEVSARLCEYDPDQDQVKVLGDVVSELKKAKVATLGALHSQILTKLIQMGDGHLYFASMNEPERDSKKPPLWGSHLWRLRMPERTWEHLLHTDEGLVALNGAGGFVYALGFPDHTLIQFNCATGSVKKISVGSVDGHFTRNFLTDSRGHVYVPRLRKLGANDALVEFDTNLKEVGEIKLGKYEYDSAIKSHGIIAYQHLPDQSIAFTTHPGRLFILRPNQGAIATLDDLGWFHPEGEAYAPSLFTCSGQQYLYGFAQRQFDEKWDFEWICFDMKSRTSKKVDVTWPSNDGPPLSAGLLYGCQTRDKEGRFYIVGTQRNKAGETKPLMLQAAFEK